jgi:catechol 2,3-dioxygenase-like lactoylglutathione lyase family enzyme
VLETGVVLELYPRRPDDAPDATRLGFRVADLALTLRRLEEAGVRPPEGGAFVVVDPDGRKVELST